MPIKNDQDKKRAKVKKKLSGAGKSVSGALGSLLSKAAAKGKKSDPYSSKKAKTKDSYGSVMGEAAATLAESRAAQPKVKGKYMKVKTNKGPNIGWAKLREQKAQYEKTKREINDYKSRGKNIINEKNSY